MKYGRLDKDRSRLALDASNPILARVAAVRVCVVDVQMDFPAFGDNIEQYMQATGTPEEVTRGRAPNLTPEIVEKYNVAMGKDGVLALSPKDGVDAGDGPSSSS